MAVPAEGAITVDTCQALLTNALIDGGIVGVDEAIEPIILNRAFTQANWLIAQWGRKRWLEYRLEEYSVVSTGAQTYSVGLNAPININPRPDRLEYAFLRILGNPVSQFNVDIYLDIIQSREDYAKFVVKSIGTIPRWIFYDPVWPVGVIYPLPIPQATVYELHLGFKVVLPRFTSIQQPINFPPDYEAAMNWCLARRLRASYQMPPDPVIDSLARDALNTIRLANAAVGVMRMPRFLRNRNRAYSYQSDDIGT